VTQQSSKIIVGLEGGQEFEMGWLCKQQVNLQQVYSQWFGLGDGEYRYNQRCGTAKEIYIIVVLTRQIFVSENRFVSKSHQAGTFLFYCFFLNWNLMK
jgi:hypothetical protein